MQSLQKSNTKVMRDINIKTKYYSNGDMLIEINKSEKREPVKPTRLSIIAQCASVLSLLKFW